MLSYIIDGPRDRQTDNKRDRQRETDRPTKRETDKTERDRKTERQVSSPVVGAQDRALVLGDVVQRAHGVHVEQRRLPLRYTHT